MGMNGDTALALAKSYVKKTLQGEGALKGKDGFSPTVKENPSNTDNDYRLDITDKNGTFTTPNLKADNNYIAETYATKVQVDEINSNLTSEISRAKETEETLKSRIDTITSLPEGSTTGDAELQDIRVKADGTTATSAGNAVREQFSELKSDLVELSDDVKDGKFFSDYAVGNLKSLAKDWLTNQYYYVSNLNVIYAQNGNDYTGFILQVKPNTDYSCTFARIVLRMSDTTNVIDKLENVTHFNSGNAEYVAISFKTTDYPVSSYCINMGTGIDDSPLKYNPTWLYHPTTKKETLYNGSNRLIRSAMSNGNIMELDEMHTKKNTVIMFRCDVSSLSDIEIGHGRNLYAGSSVEITSESYTIYKYMPTKTEVTSGSHGLTLSDFLSITIITNDELKAKIIIGTSSGTKTIDNVYWDGAVGTPFALLRNGYTTNNVLEYKCNDFKKDIFAFGDSFVTLGTNERWVYYVKSIGYDNWLLDGFGGRNSSQAIVSFRNIMKIAKPRYVLWLLGMNDSDTDDSVNSSWKSCVDEVVGYCNENDIIPILATIPCVPSTIEYPVKNKRKNDYVKSLGVRYIDFAKAVGAENDGDEWYSGMRASDAHPLAKGAEALAHQAFIDMPELLN